MLAMIPIGWWLKRDDDEPHARLFVSAVSGCFSARQVWFLDPRFDEQGKRFSTRFSVNAKGDAPQSAEQDASHGSNSVVQLREYQMGHPLEANQW